MRIFLIWPSKDPEISILISELEKNSHKILYWVGVDEVKKYKPAGTIFHNHFDAWAGLPAEEVDTSPFLPPDENLLAKFYHVESAILTMMNKRYYYMSVDERKHFYYNILQYWYGVINKYKPEVIIFPTIPHAIYNYLIYELARFFNIKTIMFEDLWIGDRLLLYNVWEDGCPALKKELEKNKDKIFSSKDLGGDLQEYFNLQTKEKNNATPEYMKHYKKLCTGRNFLFNKLKIVFTAIRDRALLKRILNFIAKTKNNPQKEYEKLQVNPDYSKNFVYVPLCYQPERTTSPQGGIFVDQILMIETLAAALPRGWVLYVKEHPSQMWFNGLNYSSCRYASYYQKISRTKNTYFVPIETDSFGLIKNCQAVATVTGTAGWEAILRLKPAIIFGYPWYRDCSGVFKVNSVETCRQAFKNIIERECVKEEKIINFLKGIDSASVAAQIDQISSFVKRKSELTRPEIMSNIARAIIENMRNNN